MTLTVKHLGELTSFISKYYPEPSTLPTVLYQASVLYDRGIHHYDLLPTAEAFKELMGKLVEAKQFFLCGWVYCLYKSMSKTPEPPRSIEDEPVETVMVKETESQSNSLHPVEKSTDVPKDLEEDMTQVDHHSMADVKFSEEDEETQLPPGHELSKTDPSTIVPMNAEPSNPPEATTEPTTNNVIVEVEPVLHDLSSNEPSVLAPTIPTRDYTIRMPDLESTFAKMQLTDPKRIDKFIKTWLHVPEGAERTEAYLDLEENAVITLLERRFFDKLTFKPNSENLVLVVTEKQINFFCKLLKNLPDEIAGRLNHDNYLSNLIANVKIVYNALRSSNHCSPPEQEFDTPMDVESLRDLRHDIHWEDLTTRVLDYTKELLKGDLSGIPIQDLTRCIRLRLYLIDHVPRNTEYRKLRISPGKYASITSQACVSGDNWYDLETGSICLHDYNTLSCYLPYSFSVTKDTRTLMDELVKRRDADGSIFMFVGDEEDQWGDAEMSKEDWCSAVQDDLVSVTGNVLTLNMLRLCFVLKDLKNKPDIFAQAQLCKDMGGSFGERLLMLENHSSKSKKRHIEETTDDHHRSKKLKSLDRAAKQELVSGVSREPMEVY